MYSKRSSGFSGIEKGWERAYAKYSINQFDLSPVKQIRCIVQPFVLDESVDGYIWILCMSEQFFYENSLNILLSNSNTNNPIETVLRYNTTRFTINSIMTTWSEISIIGKGSFGSVFKVYDNRLGSFVAVKHLSRLASNASAYHNTKKVLEYLKERYYLMQAYSSPYVIKFNHSFQLPDINGLFLVTEYCVCDMLKMLDYMASFTRHDLVAMLLRLDTTSTFDGLHDDFSKRFSTDFQKVFIIYIFEFFCILDFLASCNIAHRDIKPENVMLSQNGHLKLGDFGLVNNTRFIHDSSLMTLIPLETLKDHDTYHNSVAGTELYMEKEAILLKTKHDKSYKKLKEEPGFEAPIFDSASYIMEYSSDLWSFGVMIADLIFLGGLFTDIHDYRKEHLISLNLKGNGSLYDLAKLMCIKDIYEQIFINGFKELAHGRLKEIIKLLPEIFIDKSEGRLKDFTFPVEFSVVDKKYESRKIDLTKIETIDVFKNMNLTYDTVQFYEFDSRYLYLMGRFNNPRGTTRKALSVAEWIDYLQQNKTDVRLFSFEPGCSLKYN